MNGYKVVPRNKIASSIEGDGRMIDAAAAIANRSTSSDVVDPGIIDIFDSIPRLHGEARSLPHERNPEQFRRYIAPVFSEIRNAG
jgi:hypothetical protein